MSRSQLIEAQEVAMANMDNDTLRKIAIVMVGFKPQSLRQDPKPMTYLKEEVQDVTNFNSLEKKSWKTGFCFWEK